MKELGLDSPPILLEPIIKHLGVSAFPREFAKELSGITLTETGGKSFIAYREADHAHRRRFSVAHEIGHIILGHTNPDEYGDVKKSKANEEAEANEFAAELLMPLEFLKKDLATGISGPKELSKRYRVSEQAMWIRLENTNLLKLL